MKLAVLFTGGKDSCLALFRMKSEAVCLLTMISENIDSYMFHTPNEDVIKLQSKSMGLPLLIGKTKGVKEEELVDLKDLIKNAIKKYKIEGLVTGALFSEYQASRIENICNELGIKCINPLWRMKPEDEIKELLKNNFKFIFTTVAADGLNKSWINKIIDEKAFSELKILNKKYDVSLIGEGGCFESLVLNCPLFSKELKITDYEIKMESENCGKLIIKKVKL